MLVSFPTTSRVKCESGVPSLVSSDGQELAALFRRRRLGVCLLVLAMLAFPTGPTLADEHLAVLDAIVKVHTEVPADARTARTLGTEREGSGVVIDQDGLVLTIGYLILEAGGAEVTTSDGRKLPAKIIAYDHATGFGLLRTAIPIKVKPLKLGDSNSLTLKQRALVASHGGKDSVLAAFVVAKRDFAGSWEYLLEDAIFTSPPHPNFGGAALIGTDGQLLGIGSLIVPDALRLRPGAHLPGNMFVPISKLKPIRADLLALGQSSAPARPWLGMQAEDARGRLFVARVNWGGPAFASGVRPGDIVLKVGSAEISGLADFYRKVWALGAAGVAVLITVLQGSAVKEIEIKSSDRYSWLKIRPTI